MVKKILGIVLAGVALLLMLLTGASVLVSVAGTAMLSYNFFLGHHKGHVLHLWMLGWLLLVAVIGYVSSEAGLDDVNILFAATIAGAFATIMAYRRDVIGFYEDYYSGIRKNYFYDPPKIELRR